MNNTDTTYREKGRAVFLAAIMVLSVVAMTATFAAPAAALTDDDGENVVSDVSTVGETTTHQTDLTVEDGDAILSSGGGDDNISAITLNYSTGFTDPNTPLDNIQPTNVDVVIGGNPVGVDDVNTNLPAADGGNSAQINLTSAEPVANQTQVDVTIAGVDNPLSAETAGVTVGLLDSSDNEETIVVDLETTQPNIEVAPASATATPEENATYTVNVTDSNGDPIDDTDLVRLDDDGGASDGANTTGDTSDTTSGDASFDVASNTAGTFTLQFNETRTTNGENSTTAELDVADQGDLDIDIDPAAQGENDFTYRFNATGEDDSTEVEYIRVDFNSSSGADASAIDVENVSVAGTDTGSLSVDSVSNESASVLNITMADNFTLADESGDIIVDIDNVDVPNSGTFTSTLRFQDEGGSTTSSSSLAPQATIAGGSGTYTVAEEGLQIVDVDGPRVAAHGVEISYDVTVTNTADYNISDGEVSLNFTEDGGAGSQVEGPVTVDVNSGEEVTESFTVNTGNLPGNDSIATVDYDVTGNATDPANGTTDLQTERLKVGSDSNGGINIRVQEDLQPENGETTGVALFTLDDFTIGSDGQPDTSQAFAIEQTDGDGEASFRDLAVGESDDDPIRYVAVAAADDPNFESTTTELRLYEPSQTSTGDDVFIDRIVNANDIRVLDPDTDPADVEPVNGDRNVEVGVFTEDREPVGEEGPFPDTPVEAVITDVENPNGESVTATLNTTQQNTDSEGNATFNVNLTIDDSSNSPEDFDEDITVTVQFNATETTNGPLTVQQNLTFLAEPPSGEGTISGTVDEIDENITLGAQGHGGNIEPSVGTNVHAVQYDRLDENTITGEEGILAPTATQAAALSVAPDETEFARTVVWNETSSEVVEILDVQTDYLFWTDRYAVLTQNLTIEGTGFNAEDTDGNPGDYAVTVLEPDSELPDDHTYAVQVSDDGNFTSPNEANATFDTPNNLTYAGIQDRYSDVPAEPTDVTNSVGDFELLNLYTDGESGEFYFAIASDGNAGLGFADARGYSYGPVYQDAATGESWQEEVDLSVQAVDVRADSVDVTNNGTHPPLSETGGAPDFDEVDEFADQSDDTRQEVPRDGETIDVVELRTFVEEDDTTLGDEVTVSLTGEDVGSFDGEFADLAVGGENVARSNDNQTISLDTSAVDGDVGDGEAFVFLVTDDTDLGNDANVTIDVQLDNAAGEDSTAKNFFGQVEYNSGSITGDVSRQDAALTETFVWTRGIRDAAGNTITIEPDFANSSGVSDFEDLQSDSDVEDLIFTVEFNDSSTSTSVDESFEATGDDLRNVDLGDRIGPLTARDVSSFNLLRFTEPESSDNPGQYSMDRVPAQSAGVDYTLIEARQYDTGERGTTDARGGRSVTPGLTRNADITIPGALVTDYQLSNLDPADATVTEGDDPINVSVDVENNGLDAGEQDVTLTITNASGSVVYEDTVEDVTLDSGDTQTVEFTDVPAGDLEPGDYTHTASTGDDSVSGDLTVEESGSGPQFVLSNSSAEPDPVGSGDTLTLSADVENVGGAGSQPIELSINGTDINTSAGALDIVFVFDDTGSMGEEIDGLQNSIVEFTNAVEDSGADTRYSLVSFKDAPEVDQPYTDDVSELQDAVNGLTASGGGAIPEDSYGALVNASERDHRSDAAVAFIHITDASGLTDGGTAGPTEAATAVDDLGAQLVMISPGTPNDSGTSGPEPAANVTRFALEDVADGSHVPLADARDDPEAFADLLVEDVADRVSDDVGLELDSGETGTVEFTVDTSDLATGDFDYNITTPSDEVSGSFTVEEGTGPSLGDYTDDGTADGDTTTDLLRDAIDDWRNDEISTDLLRDVISNWRDS